MCQLSCWAKLTGTLLKDTRPLEASEATAASSLTHQEPSFSLSCFCKPPTSNQAPMCALKSKASAVFWFPRT